jgi:hypothetical protein
MSSTSPSDGSTNPAFGGAEQLQPAPGDAEQPQRAPGDAEQLQPGSDGADQLPPPEGGDERARVEAEVEEVAGEVERATKRELHEIVHSWIPLAIAIVSVLAALMGWQASLADESSAQKEELSRQDLVLQQQQLIQDSTAVNANIETFGQFAQYSSLAESMLRDASKLGGSGGDELRTQGQADLGIARVLGAQIGFLSYTFDPSNPSGNANLNSDGTYSSGHPYLPGPALATAENQDTTIHGLAPAALLDSAETEHTHGVDLTGIAALFVAVIVVLTLAMLIPGPPKVWVAGSGVLMAIAGLVLFFAVQVA